MVRVSLRHGIQNELNVFQFNKQQDTYSNKDNAKQQNANKLDITPPSSTQVVELAICDFKNNSVKEGVSHMMMKNKKKKKLKSTVCS